MDKNILSDLSEFEEAREYWTKKLKECTFSMELFSDYPVCESYSENRLDTILDDNICRILLQMSRNNDIAIFVLVLECLKVLLYKLTGEKDIVVASPVYLKTHSELNEWVLFRDQIEDGISVRQFLDITKQTVVEGYKYQFYPVDKVLSKLYGADTQRPLKYLFLMDSIHNRDYIKNLNSGNCKNDIAFVLKKDSENLCFEIIYNSKLYNHKSIGKISKCFTTILKQMLNNMEMKIADIEIADEEERNYILHHINNTAKVRPTQLTLNRLFEEQAARTPDCTAIKFITYKHGVEKSISYIEISEKSEYMSKLLVDKGCRPDTVVGIIGERCIETVISMLGILKAGGCFVVISPDLPKERLEFMLKDSGAEIIMVTSPTVYSLDLNGTILDVPEASKIPRMQHKNEISNPQNLAYMIYTSGSTGKPKAVLIEHESIANTILWRKKFYAFDEEDSILQIPSFSFDSSVEDIFTPLVSGSTVIMIEEENKLNLNCIKQVLTMNPITHFLVTPAYYKVLMKEVYEHLKKLRVITVAGEDFSSDLVIEHFNRLDKVRLCNEYGPTENSVCSTVYEFDKNRTEVLIGKPIDNVQCLILNKEGRLMPIGLPGELYLSGKGLSRGYLNNQELNSTLFIDNPIFPGSKIYKTGDRVKYTDDGNIKFLGRVDNQVKIRGFRIELGEIEARLREYANVNDTIAIIGEDSKEGKCLYAFVVSDTVLCISNIKKYLEEKLPFYMVPAFIVQVDKIPLTSHGKVDKKSLEKLAMKECAGVVKPENRTEERLLDLWVDVLQRDKDDISVIGSFFEIGGHSLNAIVLVERIKKEFDLDISLMDFIKQKTIRNIGIYLRNAKREDYLLIEPVQKKDYYPLSSAQKRVYIIQNLEPESTAYNMPFVVKLEGKLDTRKLESAINKIIQRHESLRTSFEHNGTEPCQKIYDDVCFKMEYYEQSEDSAQKIVTSFLQPFDLGKPCLLRVCLIRIGDLSYILCVDMHHIISDGMSMEIFINEFADIYSGAELESTKVSYKDYVNWQNSESIRARVANQERYWMEKFKGEIAVLNLPYDYSRAGMQSFEGFRTSFEIDSALTLQIKELAVREGVTTFIILLSAYSLFLHKITSQNDIIIGTATAGRNHADLQSVIGNFANYLALRTNIDKANSFRMLLQNTQKEVIDAFQNQDYQFEDLVEKVVTKRDSSRNAIFDTMFVFHNMKKAQVSSLPFNISEYGFVHETSQVDLKLQGREEGNILTMEFEYCTKLFKDSTIKRFQDMYIHILNQILKKPDSRLADVEITSEYEKQKILYEFNRFQCWIPQDKTFIELFKQQVENYPNNTAVVCGNCSLTYKQLDLRSGQLSGSLQENGLRLGEICGLLVERSVEMMVGIISILKTGAVYLPIDPHYPQERVEYVLNESSAKLLLLSRTMIERFDLSNTKCVVVNLSDNRNYIDANDIQQVKVLPDNLAYLIFTSGSTGKPKGVLVDHKNLVNFVQAMKLSINYGENGTFLALASISFDLSISELMFPLSCGAAVIITTDQEQQDFDTLVRIIIEKNVDFVHFTPSRLNILLENSANDAVWCRIKHMIVGGEALPESVFTRLKRKYNGRIYNFYGPTEATVWTTFKDLSGENKVTIGVPLPDAEVYIINENMQLQPLGVPGEIAIGGECVAKGYINNTPETSEKFISNPFKQDAGNIIYRTGDVARLLENGEIEYLGRSDNQVKVRGYRIELSEIEDTLLKYSGISEAVVVAKVDNEGNKFLCAFLVSDKDVNVQSIRELLASKLPFYMVPSTFIQLDMLPLTPNRKIDRIKLSSMDISKLIIDNTQKNEYKPMTSYAMILVEVWKELLSVERVNSGDDFFEMGGHSIKAINMIYRLRKELDIDIALTDIFTHSRIDELAELVQQKQQSNLEIIRFVEKKEYYPASSGQKRLYILNKLESAGLSYNLPSVFRVMGSLDTDKLQAALFELIKRHEILRTSFHIINGEIVQKIHENVNNPFCFSDGITGDIQRLFIQFVKPFDLTQPALLRVEVVRLSENEHILMFDMHHIISDATSLKILVEELCSLYEGVRLPELTIQYKEYSEWQKNSMNSNFIKEQENYWLGLYGGNAPVLDLPVDFARPTVQNFEGSVISFSFDEELSFEIGKMVVDAKTTHFVVLISIFYILLMEYSGQEDIIIGTPIQGREHPDLKELIGSFINMLPLRNYPCKDKSFDEFLSEVKENFLKAYENRYYQFEELINKLDMKRDLGRNPLFDVMFSMSNFERPEMKAFDLIFTPIEYDKGASQFDLTLQAFVDNNKILFSMEFCTKLFKVGTIRQMSRHFINIAKQVVRNPHICIDNIEIMDDKDKAEVIEQYNQMSYESPKDSSLINLFKTQVSKIPDKECAVLNGTGISYRELDRKSDSVAHYLKKHGVGKEMVVGLLVGRSFNMLVGIMGILKCGAAFLPIDPKFPVQRIRYVLDDCGTNFLLGEKEHINSIEFKGAVFDINIISKEYEIGKSYNVLEEVDVSNHDLAYVIYTSGSTGNPKGVMIERKALLNFIYAISELIDFSSSKKILALTTISFDIFILETLMPLLKGQTLVIADEMQQRDPSAIKRIICENGISIMQATPTTLKMLLSHKGSSEWLENLTEIMIGGEVLHDSLLVKLRSLYKGKIYNMYGPTETTIWSTVRNLSKCDSVDIGKPILKTQILILDKEQRPLPSGIWGEMYIAGEGVSRGYLNKPELTLARFVQDPFNSGEVMYKTGDLARWNSDGYIEIRGRNDRQVKLNGYRIELEEIERCMQSYEKIADAVVVLKNGSGENKKGEGYIVGYYIGDAEISVTILRKFLSVSLPYYMVPSVFVKLKEIPLTPNKKVDYNALPDPVRYSNSQQLKMSVKPGNDIEIVLMEIWNKVLGIDFVDINESFFDIGGNSIQIVQVYSEIEEKFPGSVTVADLFSHPSIVRLASFITEKLSDKGRKTILKTVVLPEEYFRDENVENSGSVLFAEINDDVKDKLEQELQKNDITMLVYKCAVFIYVLHIVSRQEEITVYTLSESNQIIPVSINLNNTETLWELVEEVKKKYIAGLHSGGIRIQDILLSNSRKQSREITSIIIEHGGQRTELAGLFDIVMGVSQKKDAILVSCSYNDGLLANKGISKILNAYINLTEQLMEIDN
ncbi:non-ribosomal peptide synthetase [Anaerocolumna cellulosilytica]|nr:non-ribosomal peptide synthetase [Anaerocolumna cellulosilytica]MBB5194994.1 amino acid adenylation domain-containing protein [Anaerocolumna cellulosilytica]